MGVVLTGGDVDAIAGLIALREHHAFAVTGTASIHAILDANPIFEVLARDVVGRHRIAVGARTIPARPDDPSSGLSVGLFPVPGKVPLYLENAAEPPVIAEGKDSVGAEISDGDRCLLFIPTCAGIPSGVEQPHHFGRVAGSAFTGEGPTRSCPDQLSGLRV